jgi:outer membrane autotransporter protein
MMRTQTGFTPFAKLGIVAAATRIEYATSGAVALPPGTDLVHDQADTFVKLGVGVDYAFSRSFSARLELEQMGTGSKSSRAPEQDVNVYRSIGAASLGLVYRF